MNDSDKPAGLAANEQLAMGLVFLFSLLFSCVGAFLIWKAYPEVEIGGWVLFATQVFVLAMLWHRLTRKITVAVMALEALTGFWLLFSGSQLSLSAGLVVFGVMYAKIVYHVDEREWRKQQST